MSTPDPLLRRWYALLPAAPQLGTELVARYSEPHRHYHDRRHLAEVLHTLDLLTGHVNQPRTVHLAAWFHDAIYDPRRGDNEAAAAQLARDRLSTAVPTTDTATDTSLDVAEVARLVELTASHRPEASDTNGALLCDADLAILAATPDRYDEYRTQVRAEYRHVDDAAFRQGRQAVLGHLRDLVPLYGTPTAQRDWTARAHDNLERELAELAAGTEALDP